MDKEDQCKLVLADSSEAHSVPHKTYRRCCCAGPFMNVHDGGENYTPTKYEHIANVVTHLLPAIIGIFTVPLVLYETSSNPVHAIASVIYSACMVGVFIVSSSYHIASYVLEEHRVTKFLQKCDHAVIFAFIASHYLPILLMTDIGDNNFLGKWFLVPVILVAIVGVSKIIFGIFTRIPAIPLYLTLGWIGLLLLQPIGKSDLAAWCVAELVIGMLVYTCGVPLLVKFDGIIPFAHAIWHIFVVAGASIHFYAIFLYIISSDRALYTDVTIKEVVALFFH